MLEVGRCGEEHAEHPPEEPARHVHRRVRLVGPRYTLAYGGGGAPWPAPAPACSLGARRGRALRGEKLAAPVHVRVGVGHHLRRRRRAHDAYAYAAYSCVFMALITRSSSTGRSTHGWLSPKNDGAFLGAGVARPASSTSGSNVALVPTRPRPPAARARPPPPQPAAARRPPASRVGAAIQPAARRFTS